MATGIPTCSGKRRNYFLLVERNRSFELLWLMLLDSLILSKDKREREIHAPREEHRKLFLASRDMCFRPSSLILRLNFRL